MAGSALAIWPAVVPLEPWAARPFAAGFALTFLIKLVQLQAGLVQAETVERPERFLLWLLLPPRTVYQDDKDVRAQLRAEGGRRCARALPKAAVLLILVALHARHTWPWPFSVWASAFTIYIIMSVLADVATGASMVAGFRTDEVFAAPFLARSPADFWARRWNLFVSGFLRRHVFVPVARGGHTYRGAAVVFLVSGLAHEYFVLVSVGMARYEPGYMLAFFAVQCAAVMAGAWWRAHLRPVRFAAGWAKVALHYAWLAATAPLFIYPLRTVLDQFDLWVRSWLPFTFL